MTRTANHVVYVTTGLHRGGAEIQLVEIALRMKARGWKVSVISLVDLDCDGPAAVLHAKSNGLVCALGVAVIADGHLSSVSGQKPRCCTTYIVSAANHQRDHSIEPRHPLLLFCTDRFLF